MYKVVHIWPGQTVTCLHTNSPGHIWTTLYMGQPEHFERTLVNNISLPIMTKLLCEQPVSNIVINYICFG
jgi:hypothetical protein